MSIFLLTVQGHLGFFLSCLSEFFQPLPIAQFQTSFHIFRYLLQQHPSSRYRKLLLVFYCSTTNYHKINDLLRTHPPMFSVSIGQKSRHCMLGFLLRVSQAFSIVSARLYSCVPFWRLWEESPLKLLQVASGIRALVVVGMNLPYNESLSHSEPFARKNPLF